MKNTIINSLYILLFSLFFYSCEEVINFSDETTKPMIVLNSFITPDSVVKVHISESRFFLDDNAKFKEINDAEVNIWVNDKLIEKMTATGMGYYVSSFKPQIGEVIKLTATKNKFVDVSANTSVLPIIPIVRVDTLNHEFTESLIIYTGYGNSEKMEDTVGVRKTESFKISILFNDPASEKNYYKLKVGKLNYYDDGSMDIWPAAFGLDDVVFQNNNQLDPFETSSYNYLMEFSDDFFNGKQYGLKITYIDFKETYYNNPSGDVYYPGMKKRIKQELLLELQHISTSYYQYIKTQSASNNMIEFFSEPVQIFSNIEGGIGILGSYSSSTYSIPLK